MIGTKLLNRYEITRELGRGGMDTTETIRYMDVFRKHKGNWLAVASQGTRVPRRYVITHNRSQSV